MLSLFKSNHSQQVCVLKCKGSVLDNTTIYIIEKIKDKLDDTDIQAAIATHLIFQEDITTITNERIEAIKALVKTEHKGGLKKKSLNFNADYFLKDTSFELLPYDAKYSDRQLLFIPASQGSGKTWTTKQYILRYLEQFPKNNVYLINSHDPKEDPSLKEIFSDKYKDRVKHMYPHKMLIPLEKDELPDSLVVFDDVDSTVSIDKNMLLDDPTYAEMTPEKLMRAIKQLEKLTKDIVYASAYTLVDLGRKYRTSMIWISHTLKEAKTHMISQSSDIIVYPYSNEMEIIKLFKSRTNLSENQIRYMLSTEEKYKYQPLYYKRGLEFYFYNNHIGIMNFNVSAKDLQKQK